MKRILLILILAIVSRVGYGQEIPPDSLTVKQQIEIIDSLYKSVMAIYPFELFDSLKWKDDCEKVKTQIHGSVEHSDYGIGGDDSFPGGCIRRLGRTIGIQYLYEGGIMSSDCRVVMMSGAEVTKKGNIGKVYVGDAWAADKRLQIDSLLLAVKFTDGLILDLTHMGIEEQTIDYSAGRFFDHKEEGLKILKRIQGTQDYEEIFYNVVPCGDWQYDKPMIALVSSGETISRYLMAYYLTKRSNTKLLGDTLYPPKHLYPKSVNLGYGAYVNIPTAILQMQNGGIVKSIIPDIYGKSDYGINKDMRLKGEKVLKKMISNEKKRRKLENK